MGVGVSIRLHRAGHSIGANLVEVRLHSDEQENQALRNVFAFLSLNFLDVSGVSFARMPAQQALTLMPSQLSTSPPQYAVRRLRG